MCNCYAYNNYVSLQISHGIMRCHIWQQNLIEKRGNNMEELREIFEGEKSFLNRIGLEDNRLKEMVRLFSLMESKKETILEDFQKRESSKRSIRCKK